MHHLYMLVVVLIFYQKFIYVYKITICISSCTVDHLTLSVLWVSLTNQSMVPFLKGLVVEVLMLCTQSHLLAYRLSTPGSPFYKVKIQFPLNCLKP